MTLLTGLGGDFAGRYGVERELGRGGMAIVYLAQDRKHHRPVAIKVLRPELAAAVGPERFLREIAIAANLTHPHILPLLDSGEVAGILFYVMPYVEGESLRDRLDREKQLPVDEALAITRQVASALAHAHSHDVVHRDIKPENILLQGDEVLVADFGIARAITVAGGEKLTETGIAVGTPAYMSPEQAMAEPVLDGRSDIYSLSCVLYEMLVGEPPYTGPTAQAILARRLTDPVPPLRTVRESVPEELERAIAKALARVPADRFATATLFSAALSGGGGAAVPRPDVSRRVMAWVAGSVVALGAMTALVVSGRFRNSVALDPNLVAVAPFDVRGAELSSWGEGMVDYLSRSLDGAGAMRTVSPSILLRRWTGHADPASARTLGQRTGARLVVLGSVVKGVGDSVRLRASLFDVASGAPGAEVEVTGDTLGIDRVADKLAQNLITELGGTRPVGAVRNSPLGGVALPALKEFLRGEQMYRRSLWDSALAHYSRAVALDNSFALAYRRMSLVLGWGPTTMAEFQPSDAYLLKSAALNHGLGLRDSLLIAADSLSWAVIHALYQAEDPAFFGLHHRLFATLDEAARLYPGDPEVWQAVGEARYHSGQPLFTPAEILQPFDRAIALDSGFAPAYEHVLQLAMKVSGPDLARRYATAYTSLNPKDMNAASLRLTAALLDPGQARTPDVGRWIDTAAAGTLIKACLENLGVWADSAETAVRLLRSLGEGHRSTAGMPWWADSLMWGQYLAYVLLFRGHLQEAYAIYQPLISHPDTNWWAWAANPFLDLALLGAVPADTAVAIFERHATPGARWGEAWWFARGDTIALSRFIGWADRAARGDSRLGGLRARYHGAAAAAYLALARGDSAGALRGLESLPDSLCLITATFRSPTACFFPKLTLARLLAARGEDRRAEEILDRWRWGGSSGSPFFVIATLELGRIAERLGERGRAITSYQYVVDVWRRADPELQRYVVDARDGLRRLGAEPRR